MNFDFHLRIIYSSGKDYVKDPFYEIFTKIIFGLTDKKFDEEKTKYVTLFNNLLTYNFRHLKQTTAHKHVLNLMYSSMFKSYLNKHLILNIKKKYFKQILMVM